MDLKFIPQLNESSQYRSIMSFKYTNARVICDFAFMDLVALWILFNEYEYAPKAIEYAARTAMFHNFKRYRQLGTDLYLNLHVITEKRLDLLDEKPADRILLDRVHVDVPEVLLYLRRISQNYMTESMIRMALQKFEQGFCIQDSNYRSIRRLAQNWPNLTTSEKRITLTRMIFFYRSRAMKSKIYQLLSSLANSKGLIEPNAKNPEKIRISEEKNKRD